MHTQNYCSQIFSSAAIKVAVVDRFYTALFSGLDQTYCALVVEAILNERLSLFIAGF